MFSYKCDKSTKNMTNSFIYLLFYEKNFKQFSSKRLEAF